jgi:hypothetical protein
MMTYDLAADFVTVNAGAGAQASVGLQRGQTSDLREDRVSSTCPVQNSIVSEKPMYDVVLSLGPTCRPKYQINRVAKSQSPRGVFDWQITPTSALVAYLDRDFAGIFEAIDMELFEEKAWNKAFLTLHPHDFPLGMKSTADLLRNYLGARQRHLHLVDKTRSILKSSQRCLLVLGRLDEGYAVGEVEGAIRRYAPTLNFRLLTAPSLEGPATPPEEDWQGNDEIWGRHLMDALGDRVRMPVT